MGFFDSIIDEKSVNPAAAGTNGIVSVVDPVANTSGTGTGSGGTGVTTDDSLIIIDDSPSITVANTAAEMFSPNAEPVNDSVIQFTDSPVQAPAESAPVEVVFNDVTPVDARVNLMPSMDQDVAISVVQTPQEEVQTPQAIEETTVTHTETTSTSVVTSAEVPDVDATLGRAIADLKANDKRIEEQVKKALDEEAQLRAEQAAKEEAHAAEMKRLASEAEAKKIQAEEIRKSGERTKELIQLFESQIQA